jgi:hypothetical protein
MNTPMSIVISLDKKKAKIREKVAAYETVTVTLEDVVGFVATDLRLSLIRDGVECTYCNTFVDMGNGTFQGVLDLSTPQVVDFFTDLEGRDTIDFQATIWDETNENLLINTILPVMNNPYYPGMPSPTPGIGGISVNDALVNMTAHGFTLGQVIRKTAATWLLAQADTLTGCLSVGVVSRVIDADHFRVTFSGVISGFSSLGFAEGDVCYLSASSAGALTTTAPTAAGQFQRPVLQFIDATADKAVVLALDPVAVTNDVLSLTEGVAIPSASVGQAKIFVDTADGDLKCRFADGVVVRIVTDTP